MPELRRKPCGRANARASRALRDLVISARAIGHQGRRWWFRGRVPFSVLAALDDARRISSFDPDRAGPENRIRVALGSAPSRAPGEGSRWPSLDELAHLEFERSDARRGCLNGGLAVGGQALLPFVEQQLDA